MAENNEGVKLGLADSPSEESQEVQEKPPVEANSTPEQTEQNGEPQKEQAVPYERFKEVVDQKNDFANRLDSLESQIKRQSEATTSDPLDEAVKSLVDAGMEEPSARKLAKAQFDIASKVTEERIRPIEESTKRVESSSMIQDFADRHKDYYDLEPVMFEVYKTLDPETQLDIATKPKSLEMFYSYVKLENSKKSGDERYNQGVEDGYKNKQSKGALSSVSGARSKPEGIPTPKEIGEMSLEDYRKVRDKVLKANTPS